MVPVTKTWEELGFKGIPEARPQVEKGVDLFEKLPDADKEKILGKAGFQAYKAGVVKFEDFVGRRLSRRWGTMRYARSLRDILWPKGARKWVTEAIKAQRLQDEPNKLIREWLNPKRMPTEAEIKRVLAHVARAPFSTRPVAVDKSIRGQVFQGRKLGDREPSIIAHFAKRVLINRQWTGDVTPAEFVDHLHFAFLEQSAKRAVYVGHDQRTYFSVLAPNTIPSDRLGSDSQPFLWVVYTADYGTIVTGYQVPGIEEITLPAKVRWL
jgi:hypothetical protein